MGMKKALKRNLHVVKPSCRSTESCQISSSPSLLKFTDKLPFLWHLLDHKLPKMGRKLKQSLEVLILVLWSTQKPDITAWWHRKNGCLLSYMNSYHDSHIMSKHIKKYMMISELLSFNNQFLPMSSCNYTRFWFGYKNFCDSAAFKRTVCKVRIITNEKWLFCSYFQVSRYCINGF